MKFTRDKRFWDEHEWGNRKPEWHWHAYRRHMVRRREQACELASSARWRRVRKPLLDRLFRNAADMVGNVHGDAGELLGSQPLKSQLPIETYHRIGALRDRRDGTR